MANTHQTDKMNLVLPDVGVQTGPQWSQDLDNAFEKIDEHDHSSGKGVKVPTAGLNINDDLPFNSNDAISLRSTQFTNQISTLPNSDIRALYVASGNLYFNNNSGAPIQLTTGTNINTGALALNIWSYLPINTNTTIPANSPAIYLAVNTGSSSKTINLPLANSVTAGRYFIVKDKNGLAGTNIIYVSPQGTDSIEGLTSFVEQINYNYGSTMFVSDGVSNWSTFKQRTDAATGVQQGSIRLGGDLAGSGSTANAPRVVDATASVKGKLALGGDLNGDGSSSTTPTIGKLTGISGAVSLGNTPSTASNFGGFKLSAPSAPNSYFTGMSVRNTSNSGNVNLVCLSLNNEVEISSTDTVSIRRGGAKEEVHTVTTTYTVDSRAGFKDNIILVNQTNSSQFIITLPAVPNRVLQFKDISGQANFVLNCAGKTIDGLLGGRRFWSNYNSWKLVSDNNSNWWIL